MGEYRFTEAEKQVLKTDGLLVGLEKLARQNPGLERGYSEYRSGWLGIWMQRDLKEAETEVAKIHAALKRLQSVSMNIEAAKRISAADPRVAQFKKDLDALDGWTVSLFETVLKIVGILDKAKARRKLTSFNTAMQALMAKRVQADDAFLKDPSLFKEYMS